MPSSISSSSDTPAKSAKQTYTTTFLNVGLTLVCVAIGAHFRMATFGPQRETGVPRSTFFQEKITTTDRYTALFAGDSRVYRGLSPEDFAPVLGLPPAEVLNFGFSSCAYNDAYLSRIDELLRHGESSLLVLCFDSNSFLAEALQKNGFLRYESAYGSVRKDRTLALKQCVTSRIEPLASSRFFAPLQFKELRRIARKGQLAPRRSRVLKQHFSPSGWVASNAQPRIADLYYDRYEDKLSHKSPDENAVANLLQWVESWRAAGIAVYGVRLPTDAGLRAREDLFLMDWGGFRQDFQKVGGTWIDIPGTGYVTYDGNHLEEQSARRFSVDLAMRIRQTRVR